MSGREAWKLDDLDGYIREGKQRSAEQHTPQATPQIELLLQALGNDELGARELMGKLGLSDRKSFTKLYLNPALKADLIERTIPEKPTSRMQKYRAVKRSAI